MRAHGKTKTIRRVRGDTMPGAGPKWCRACETMSVREAGDDTPCRMCGTPYPPFTMGVVDFTPGGQLGLMQDKERAQERRHQRLAGTQKRELEHKTNREGGGAPGIKDDREWKRSPGGSGRTPKAPKRHRHK